MNLKLIVCVDSNYGIGYQGNLLYKDADDLKHFKEITDNGLLVMGRKTHESIRNGQALPNRKHLVLTTDVNYTSNEKDVYIVRNIDDLKQTIIALKFLTGQDFPLFLVGGGQIYDLLIDYVDEIYLTEISETAEKVDTYFNKNLLEGFTLSKSTTLNNTATLKKFKR